MTNTVTISCILNTTDASADLGFEAWVDDKKFVDIDHVKSEQKIQLEIPDADAEHELKFLLKNKTTEHTKIDKDGNIISDSMLTITDLSFEEIKLGHTATELATYSHDFNGTQQLTQHKFYGNLGCNGTVALKFTTPVYLWLLEHL